jgi:probable 2-oxoglutarate dehydrogenase E1 component DHKTD1
MHGHRLASVDPIKWLDGKEEVPELEFSRYGLEESQQLTGLEGIVSFSDSNVQTIADLKKRLVETYCANVSAEFSYIENEFEREWFTENYEKMVEEKALITSEEKRQLATTMLQYQEFDRFMGTKLPAIKRYGGEGAESMVAFFTTLLKNAALDDVSSIVLGMPHRGKLNALVSLFKHRPARIFRKYKGLPEFRHDVKAMMDITNHFSVSEDFEFDGKSVHLSMLPNPSHLEAVNPVSMGKTRSKQQSIRDGAFNDDQEKKFGSDVINVILHGDAAIAGQGVNQECAMMAYTPNYDIGGTIHMAVNNQIGFTTPGDRGRSSRYCTDIAKSINAPVIHVNSDDPEMVGVVAKLAFKYQRIFRKDVFIDLNCFRRMGHNEVDDPTVTNPCMYKLIHGKK